MKDTKVQILKQAAIYFTKNDYERASLNDIAGALGITKGGIYHYFKSKDELFKEVVLYTLEEIQNQFIAMSQPQNGIPFKEMLKIWYSIDDSCFDTTEFAGFNIIDEYENTMYLVFTAMKKFPEVHAKMNEIYTKLIEQLNQLLILAQEKGEIRNDLDTEALAFEICAFGEGSLLLGNYIKPRSLSNMSLRTFENFWGRIKNC